MLLTGIAAELEGDYDRGAALATEASEIAERLLNPRCLIWLAGSVGRVGNSGDGLRHASRAVRHARERGFVATLPHALQAQASQLIGLSQFDLAYAVAHEARQLALDLGFPWAASWAVADLAYVDSVRGDEALARAHLKELEQLTTTASPAVPTGINRALGTLALGLGRPSEALDRLLASIASVRPQSNPMLVGGVPDAIEAAARAEGSEEMAEHLARYATWVQSSRTRPAERCSRAVKRSMARPTPSTSSPRRSGWSTRWPHSTAREHTSSTASGCAASNAEEQTLAPICVPHLRPSSRSSASRRGRNAHGPTARKRRDSAPAARRLHP